MYYEVSESRPGVKPHGFESWLHYKLQKFWASYLSPLSLTYTWGIITDEDSASQNMYNANALTGTQ